MNGKKSGKIFLDQKKEIKMSEFSDCIDFNTLMKSYKKEKKLEKYLNTPKMKKLHKGAMKLQGGDKVIKMVKDQAES